MRYLPIAACSLTAALLLSACGFGKAEPPQEYVLEENSLPSLTTLVPLEDEEMSFQESAGEDGAVTYVYSQLTSGCKTAEKYAQALQSEYDCMLATDSKTSGAPDFSTSPGQVLAAQKLEDSEQLFLLTIQWEDTSCSVTPALADESAFPSQESSSLTLEEAEAYLRRSPPSALGLPGTSMDEYLIYPQEGTVYLDNQPCLMLNIYSAADHQFQQSYLLVTSTMEVYALDRSTGQATPVK